MTAPETKSNSFAWHGKAILGFISLVITNLLANYAGADSVLPVNEAGQLDITKLLINVLTVVAGTLSVYKWDNNKYAPAGELAKAQVRNNKVVGKHEKPEGPTPGAGST
jgi:hypothetical protein